jgi:hypothetical protein
MSIIPLLFLIQIKAILYRNYRIHTRSWNRWISCWILILPFILWISLLRLSSMRHNHFNREEFPLNLITTTTNPYLVDDNRFIVTFSYLIHEEKDSCSSFGSPNYHHHHRYSYFMNISVFVDIIHRNRYISIHSIEKSHMASPSPHQPQMKGKL